MEVGDLHKVWEIRALKTLSAHSSTECEELVSKGITGPGQCFDGTGRRLGGFSIHPPPPSLPKATVSATRKWAKNGALQPSVPRKLGGNNYVMSALSPAQAAAMAAERRMQDDLWCGSHDQFGIDDSENIVTLEQAPNFTTRDRKHTKAGKNTKVVFSSSSAESSTSSESQVAAPGDSSSSRTTDAGISSLWESSACTLLNQDRTFGQAPAAMSCLVSSCCLCYHCISILPSCREEHQALAWYSISVSKAY
ncbi:uncharacterized protein LOC124664134 [Lolium rigidum]|uniref:uncharacterized protein LOC124664134 n=1 Tax=Lolium rigidum TaxID=89674 RepID=UPI001F5DD57C|nr:uncharacterized protein LOC124664134 [Lolium rigidum]